MIKYKNQKKRESSLKKKMKDCSTKKHRNYYPQLREVKRVQEEAKLGEIRQRGSSTQAKKEV